MLARSTPAMVLVLMTIVLSSCQSTSRPLPPDANVTVRNKTHFPDYVWTGKGISSSPSIPKPITRVDPIYPRELIGTKLQGAALVEFAIEPDGSTSHVQIRNATNRYFAAAAMATVKKWKFIPAFHEGKAIAMRAVQEIIFSPD